MKPTDELISKIRKLMTLEKGAKELGNTAEAANAAARIQDILLKYNLDMSTVENVGEETDIAEDKMDWTQFWKKSEGDWVKALAHAISKANLCKSISVNHGEGKYSLLLVGETQNIIVVRYLIEFLITRAREICRKDFKTYEGLGGPQKWGVFRRSFFNGFAIVIAARVKEQTQTQPQQVQGLILVHDAKVKEYLDNNHRNLRPGKPMKQNGNHGRVFGVQAGRDISLNKAIDLERKAESRMLN